MCQSQCQEFSLFKSVLTDEELDKRRCGVRRQKFCCKEKQSTAGYRPVPQGSQTAATTRTTITTTVTTTTSTTATTARQPQCSDYENEGFECVSQSSCDDSGDIITDGGSKFDIRQDDVDSLGYLGKCPGQQVCCRDPFV